MKLLKKLTGALACAALTLTTPALATGPSTPIKLIVPYAAGGSTDIVARALAQVVSSSLGRPVVVENKAGGGGNIGSALVANAAPDSNTLLINGTSPLSISAASGQPMNFDPMKHLTPIGMVTRLPNVVTVNASLPINSIEELVAYGKANPGKLSYGMSAVGNLSHLNAEMFAAAAGITLVGVPYKGSAPLITDMLGGHVQLAFDNLPPYLPHIGGGKIRALAVTSAKRSATLPGVPALAEVGFPGFDNPAIFAIWGPRDMPAEQVAVFNKAFTEALRDPQLVATLKPQAIEPSPSSPQELAQRMRAERETFGLIIQRANIKLN